MEKLICSDERLSRADEELNLAYRQALTAANAKPTVVAWQRDWLRSPQVLDCSTVRCLMDAYSARLKLLRDAASARDSTAWTGRFARKEDPDRSTLLLVGLSGNRVYISGMSQWHGPNAASGQVNIGSIEGVGTISGNRLVFDQQGCRGTLLLNRDGVIVSDESGCGGLNVSFNGEYRRK